WNVGQGDGGEVGEIDRRESPRRETLRPEKSGETERQLQKPGTLSGGDDGNARSVDHPEGEVTPVVLFQIIPLHLDVSPQKTAPLRRSRKFHGNRFSRRKRDRRLGLTPLLDVERYRRVLYLLVTIVVYPRPHVEWFVRLED